MPNATVVSTVFHFEKLRQDPNNKGRTFEITKEVFEHFSVNLRDKLQRIDEGEIRSLKNLLCLDSLNITAGAHP